MKKGLLFVFGAVAFMFIGMSNVYAADIGDADFASAKTGTPSNGVSYDAGKYTLAAGDYTFTDSIDISADLDDYIELNGDTTINLNGKTIKGNAIGNTYNTLINIVNGTVTISGSGTIDNIYASSKALNQVAGTLSLAGGTYNQPVEIRGTATISGGTFTIVNGYNGSNVTITGGTFNSTLGAAVNLEGATSLISGGTFTSTNTPVMINSGTSRVTGGTFTGTGWGGFQAINVTELKISGGTFAGPIAGLVIEDSTVILSGGTYRSTGDDPQSCAIVMYGGTTMDALLASGYKYSAGGAYTEQSGAKIMTAKENSVISESASGTVSDATGVETTTTSAIKLKNPNTGDNILLYIVLLTISSLSVVITYNKLKKSM